MFGFFDLEFKMDDINKHEPLHSSLRLNIEIFKNKIDIPL